MESWSIRPAPTVRDPLRHTLLLKGSMKEVSVVLRRFGSLCGRPSSKSVPDGFNFSLPLHGVTTETMERLSAALGELFGFPAAKPVPDSAPGLALPAAAQPPAAPAALPAAPAAVALGPFSEDPIEQAPPAQNAASELISLAPLPAAVETPAPVTPAPATPAPTPVAPAAPPSALKPKRWGGFRLALDALQSFDTLQVGPYNRFAHAAATSVVTSPGSMYNPLFLYGGPAVGKTHFLNAIARGLCGSGPEESVVVTTGCRLSTAVSAALAAATFDELKDELGKSRCLVIDDVHLISVTEQNRSALADIFALFLGNGRQVVLSSTYPPKALSGLEEALKISLAKGWAVDLKVPPANIQVELIHAWLDRQNVRMSIDEIRSFHDRLGPSYSDVVIWMKRLAAMCRLSPFSEGKKAADHLPLLFDPGLGAEELPNPADLERTRSFQPPPAGPDALALAIVVPKGHELMAGWVANGFHQAAKQYSIAQAYKHVHLHSYDAGQPFGVPFQIGEACRRAGAQAALVVGPPHETSLAGRLAEFRHAVIHVLESHDVACGWLQHRGTTAVGPYLRAHLDFLYAKTQ